MAKYAIPTNPPTIALMPVIVAAPGYLGDPWWQGGGLVLDDAQYIASGKSKDNILYNLTGQSLIGAPVLRVLSVAPGLQGWVPGDLATMSYSGTFGGAPNRLLPFLSIDETKLPPVPPPANGGTYVPTWAVAVKVVAVDDAGHPLPTGGGTPPPPPPPPNPGSGGNGQAQLPYYNAQGQYVQPYQGYPNGVYVPPPSPGGVIDPLMALLLLGSTNKTPDREPETAQERIQIAQLQAAADAREDARQQQAIQQQNEDRAARRQAAQQKADYERQRQELDLEERRQRIADRRKPTNRDLL